MVMIQFECADAKVADAIDAIGPFAIGKPLLFATQPLPASPKKDAEFEKLAQDVARAVRPRANQTVRLDALKLVLFGGDTFRNQQGEADPGLRNATGALSKALRKFSPWDSPLDILCERRRETVPNGPFKGMYQGTRYIPTRLGKRVRAILHEQKIL